MTSVLSRLSAYTLPEWLWNVVNVLCVSMHVCVCVLVHSMCVYVCVCLRILYMNAERRGGEVVL